MYHIFLNLQMPEDLHGFKIKIASEKQQTLVKKKKLEKTSVIKAAQDSDESTFIFQVS